MRIPVKNATFYRINSDIPLRVSDPQEEGFQGLTTWTDENQVFKTPCAELEVFINEDDSEQIQTLESGLELFKIRYEVLSEKFDSLQDKFDDLHAKHLELKNCEEKTLDLLLATRDRAELLD